MIMNVQEAAAILFTSTTPQPPNTKAARKPCNQLIAIFKSMTPQTRNPPRRDPKHLVPAVVAIFFSPVRHALMPSLKARREDIARTQKERAQLVVSCTHSPYPERLANINTAPAGHCAETLLRIIADTWSESMDIRFLAVTTETLQAKGPCWNCANMMNITPGKFPQANAFVQSILAKQQTLAAPTL